MKRPALFGWSLCLLWAFFSVSCVQKEYVVDELDLTVNVGGDSLALPLGSTDTIYARTLLDNAGDGAEAFLKELEDGTLAIRQDGNFSMEVPDVAVERMTLPDFKGASVCRLEFHAGTQAEGMERTGVAAAGAGVALTGKAGTLSAPVADAIDIETGLNDIPEDVKRIDYLGLEASAELVFLFVVPELADHPDIGMALDLTVELPDYVVPAPEAGVSDGKLHIRADMRNGRYEEKMPISGFNLSDCPIAASALSMVGEFVYGGTLTLTADDAVVLAQYEGKTVDLETAYQVENLNPTHFEGLLEPDLEPTVDRVALDGIPDVLSGDGTVFDFYAPYLLVSVPTNLGLNLDNVLRLTPFSGGQAQTDATVQAVLTLPARTDARMDTTKYYVANRRPENLSADYTFVEADLASLLERIPEALEIEVRTTVDEAAECIYDFGVHYTAGVEYDFTVPMAFGPDLHLTFGDTVSALSDIINEILSKNVLRLGGEVQNSLPMDLTLNVVALDDNGEEVPMETEPQFIKAGTPSGEAIGTPLALTLGDRTGTVDTRPVRALALQFTMTTGQDNAGVPVKATSWVRAVLKAEIPGGITVDLKELGTNGEGEEPTPDNGRNDGPEDGTSSVTGQN